RALLAAGRLELTGTGAAGRDALDLLDLAVLGPPVVDDAILDLVRLNVEVAAVAIHGLHRRLVGHGSRLLSLFARAWSRHVCDGPRGSYRRGGPTSAPRSVRG